MRTQYLQNLLNKVTPTKEWGKDFIDDMGNPIQMKYLEIDSENPSEVELIYTAERLADKLVWYDATFFITFERKKMNFENFLIFTQNVDEYCRVRNL